MTKEYKCECGKIFTSPNSFNGHKSNCKVHQLNKYGSLGLLDAHNNSFQIGATKLKNIQSEKVKEKKQLDLDKWISEQRTCEKCGKIMTEKYGSGRFCSRACANSRKRTEESREKTSNSLKLNNQIPGIKVKAILKYNSNPNLCKNCGTIIPYEQRRRKYCNICVSRRSSENIKRLQLEGKYSYILYLKICPQCNNHFEGPRYKKYCSDKCYKISMSDQMSNHIINDSDYAKSLRTKYKFGTYKGIECDSSWELAFVIYNLDHNIKFNRCREIFTYNLNEEYHSYIPDFIIDGIYYEIKGYKDIKTIAKIDAFPKEKQLIVLYKKEIQPYLKYARDTYGKDFTKLYDRNYPSWMDRLEKEDISNS